MNTPQARRDVHAFGLTGARGHRRVQLHRHRSLGALVNVLGAALDRHDARRVAGSNTCGFPRCRGVECAGTSRICGRVYWVGACSHRVRACLLRGSPRFKQADVFSAADAGVGQHFLGRHDGADPVAVRIIRIRNLAATIAISKPIERKEKHESSKSQKTTLLFSKKSTFPGDKTPCINCEFLY